MIITQDYSIYQLPCGDFCGTTCLDQAEAVPELEVRRIYYRRGSRLNARGC